MSDLAKIVWALLHFLVNIPSDLGTLAFNSPFFFSIFLEAGFYTCKTLIKKLYEVLTWNDSATQRKAEMKASLRFDQILNERPNPKISVVIPCLNEVSNIHRLLEQITTEENIEVIVADGGSTDGSVNVCKNFPRVTIIEEGGNSRSECLNAGAAVAHGEIIMFLHADSILLGDWSKVVRQELADPDVTIGAFSFQFSLDDLNEYPLLCLVVWGTNIRARWLSLPYGDQSIFMYKNIFQTLGKFPVQPLMEDYDFVLRARSLGRVRVSDYPILTSARRWVANGVVRNTLFNSIVLMGHSVGVPIQNLARWYYGGSMRKQY